MTNAIAAYFNVAETFVTDLSVSDGYASFMLNGAWYSAQVTKTGKLKNNSIRRG